VAGKEHLPTASSGGVALSPAVGAAVEADIETGVSAADGAAVATDTEKEAEAAKRIATASKVTARRQAIVADDFAPQERDGKSMEQ